MIKIINGWQNESVDLHVLCTSVGLGLNVCGIRSIQSPQDLSIEADFHGRILCCGFWIMSHVLMPHSWNCLMGYVSIHKGARPPCILFVFGVLCWNSPCLLFLLHQQKHHDNLWQLAEAWHVDLYIISPVPTQTKPNWPHFTRCHPISSKTRWWSKEFDHKGISCPVAVGAG